MGLKIWGTIAMTSICVGCLPTKPTSSALNEPSTAAPVVDNTPVADMNLSLSSPLTGSLSQNLFSLKALGAGMTHFKYKVGLASSLNCSLETGYSTVLAAADNLNLDVSSLADGNLRLCLWAGVSASRFEAVTSAQAFEWNKISYLDASLGYYHSCFVKGSKEVFCYGNNSYSQLGDGTTGKNPSFTPVKVAGIDNATQVVVNQYSACALLTTGGVKCWGRGDSGQLGDGTLTNTGITGKLNAVPVLNISTAVKIASSYAANSFCALLSDGKVNCWGAGGNYRLGNGSTANKSTPVEVIGVIGAKDLAVGDSFGCVVTSSNNLNCWGGGTSGQLGNNTSADSSALVTVLDQDGTTAVAGAMKVKTSGTAACALLGDFTLKCWGLNNSNKMTTFSGINTKLAFPFAGTYYADDFVGGYDHMCLLVAGGSLSCAGSNSRGQFANRDIASQSTLNGLNGLFGLQKVFSGPYSSCALKLDGRMVCWGSNNLGQLGNGSANSVSSPTELSDSGTVGLFKKYSDVPSGRCGVDSTSGKNVYCWGAAGSQTGTGNTTQNFFEPKSIGLGSVNELVGSDSAYCALKTDKTLSCWGTNTSGQLGEGTAAGSRSTPVNSLLTGVDKLVGGASFYCGLVSGVVSCWGDNSCGSATNAGTCGQLGINTSDVFKNTPTALSGGFTGILDIAAAAQTACAIKSDKSVICWGLGTSGQLGNSAASNSIAPVAVTGITTASKIYGSRNSFCVLLEDASVKCWGSNASGNLGDNTTTNRTSPVTVLKSPTETALPLSGVSILGSYKNGFCAVVSGAVKCWGDNTSNELLAGATGLSSTTPVVVVASTTGVTRLSSQAISDGICFLTGSSGNWSCWGNNEFNQIPLPLTNPHSGPFYWK